MLRNVPRIGPTYTLARGSPRTGDWSWRRLGRGSGTGVPSARGGEPGTGVPKARATRESRGSESEAALAKPGSEGDGSSGSKIAQANRAATGHTYRASPLDGLTNSTRPLIRSQIRPNVAICTSV